jgi:hypothetical protein
MADIIRCCVDRPCGARPTDYAAMPSQYRWPNGSTLKVRFLNGPDKVRERIIPYAQKWSEHANIRFDFGDHADAAIRIAIRDDDKFRDAGSWSYLGTYALNIDDPEPTMNFGWLTTATAEDEYSRVVLHEFGHALGLIHEHQSPGAEIPWDRPAVYQYYEGPPNRWKPAEVDAQVFARYAGLNTQYTKFDTGSIMLYPIPGALTKDRLKVGWNRELSPTDIDFIGRMYPLPRCCVDPTVDGDEMPDYAALVTAKKWPKGEVLKIRFLNGPESVQRKVISYALQWTQYANIRFDFGDHADAAIRIAIRDNVKFHDASSWSSLGTYALDVGPDSQTMNFGWLTRATAEDEYSRVVLHEFGHALGLIHEHQSPGAEIPWDKPAVYAHYKRTSGWNPAQVDSQVFKRYARRLTQYTAFDTNSIMLYPIDKGLTTNGLEVGWNRVLSPTDIAFIRKMYPR